MIVMPANATGVKVGYLACKYERAPARLGHLYSPGSQTGPHESLPYALDNGAYGAFTRGESFDFDAWAELLAWARNSGQQPMWALVPDVVGDRDGTLRLWARWSRAVADNGWPLAFAAQDGMTPADVPPTADVVFIGGSTEWKWSNLTEWARTFPRVHVGRVNSLRQLRICAAAGVESCDGTGFSRTTRQWNELKTFLAEMAGEIPVDNQLCESFDGIDAETASGWKSSKTDERSPCGEGR